MMLWSSVYSGDFSSGLMVETSPSNVGGPGSTPGGRTKILQAVKQKNKNKNKKPNNNKNRI